MKETIKIDLNWVKDLLIQIKIMINPRYLLMNERYCKTWNKELNRLMNEYSFTNIEEHTTKLGDTTIWISNHPYASFTNYNSFGSDRTGRPSKLTIYKAKQKLERDRVNQLQPMGRNPTLTPIQSFTQGGLITNINPCNEIPLGNMMMSGSSITYIPENDNNYIEVTLPELMLVDSFKPAIGDLKNGIPNNWDGEI